MQKIACQSIIAVKLLMLLICHTATAEAVTNFIIRSLIEICLYALISFLEKKLNPHFCHNYGRTEGIIHMQRNF